ncbi:hypothetical protein HanPI659440_Chr03g0103351 [Helianthus annuus]|nr:hypothetical protein HanPI659440_Chr03g0103351 [Helianthus annuus]
MSFKEAFTGAAVGRTIKIDDNIMAFEEFHGRAVVVRVTSVWVLKNIRNILKERGLAEGEVRCLGGFVCLIIFRSNDHAMMAKDEFIGRPDQFGSVSIWEGQVVSFERLAWLRVYGLPLCLMDNQVLNEVGSFFGTVVKCSQVERTDVDVSFHYIGILVGSGNHIHDRIFIKWRGKTIKVWVKEDAKEWLVDFVDKYEVGGRRSSGSVLEHSPASEVNADEKVSEEEDFTGNVFMTPVNADLLPIV